MLLLVLAMGDPWQQGSDATTTLKWTAERLKMGTWANLSDLLSQERRKREPWCHSAGPAFFFVFSNYYRLADGFVLAAFG